MHTVPYISKVFNTARSMYIFKCKSTKFLFSSSTAPIECPIIGQHDPVNTNCEHHSSGSMDKYTWQRNLKIGSFFLGWVFFTIILAQGDEKVIQYKQLAIDEFATRC